MSHEHEDVLLMFCTHSKQRKWFVFAWDISVGVHLFPVAAEEAAALYD
jgi:hypothetical protein